MSGVEGSIALVQVSLSGASLYSLLTDSVKLALVFMFAIYLVGFLASILFNRAACE